MNVREVVSPYTNSEDLTAAIKDVMDNLLTLEDVKKLLADQISHDATIMSSDNAPKTLKRPLNGFLIWANLQRCHLKKVYESSKIRTTIISKALGDKWRTMTDEDRRPFYAKAEILRNDFKEKICSLGIVPTRKKIIRADEAVKAKRGRKKKEFRKYVLVEQNNLKIRLRLAKSPVSGCLKPLIPDCPEPSLPNCSKSDITVNKSQCQLGGAKPDEPEEKPVYNFDPSIYGEYFKNIPTLDDLINIDEEIDESFQHLRSETSSPATYIPESPDSGFLEEQSLNESQLVGIKVAFPNAFHNFQQYNSCDPYNLLMDCDTSLLMNEPPQPVICQPPVTIVSDANFYPINGYSYMRSDIRQNIIYPGV